MLSGDVLYPVSWHFNGREQMFLLNWMPSRLLFFNVLHCLFVCLFVCSKIRSTQCGKVYVMRISTTCKTNEYVSHYFQSCLQQRLIYPLASNTDILGLVTHSWGGMDCVTGTKNVCVGGYVSLRHSRLRVVSNFGDGD